MELHLESDWETIREDPVGEFTRRLHAARTDEERADARAAFDQAPA